MIKFFDTKELPEFILLRRHLMNAINVKRSQGPSQMMLGEMLRDDIPLMVECENCLKHLINRFKIDESMRSMQFPMNVRVLGGGSKTNATHSYDTHKIHIDAWSGAPVDTHNVVLFIDIKGDPDCIDFYEFLNRDLIHETIAFRGPYDQALTLYPARRLETPKAQIGQLIVFDQTVPHVTQKKHREGARVSIDVRLRPEAPYIDKGRRIDREKFLNYLPGNPGWGYYWSISPPTKKFLSFEDKSEYELRVSRDFGPNEELLRREYIDLVMKDSVFSLRRRSDD
jgi:hypothetical protein